MQIFDLTSKKSIHFLLVKSAYVNRSPCLLQFLIVSVKVDLWSCVGDKWNSILIDVFKTKKILLGSCSRVQSSVNYLALYFAILGDLWWKKAHSIEIDRNPWLGSSATEPAGGKVEIPSIVPIDCIVQLIHSIRRTLLQFLRNWYVVCVVYWIPVVCRQLRKLSSTS